jgi:hypothetical protein
MLLATASVGLAISVEGCRESRPPTPKAVVAEADPMTQAREAMGRHDYGGALAFLRNVVVREPANLEAHYRLGVSASHLDQVEPAAREFEWVVAHGAAGAPEVEVARDWLASRRSVKVATPVVSSPAGDALAQKPDLASLSGTAVGPDKPLARLQLFLKGVPSTAVEREYHVLRTDPQGNFRFTNVVPGDYMLTNAVAGRPTWRLRVSLVKGERLVLDLSPSNQAEIRDDFRDLRS